MSARRAAEAYDSVTRRIRFSEQHPHVHIEHRSAPHWHWEATWIRADGRQAVKVDYDLGGLIDTLERLDWTEESPQPTPPPDAE